jgi:putative NADH-flavin reductase
MTTLVIGASGATGKHLVHELIKLGQKVKIIVRSNSKIPDKWNNNEQLTIIKKNIAEITIEEMSEIIADCQSVASCLGHNLSLKGLFGKPRRLVTDSVELLCQAIIENKKKTKFVLMNTAGNSNRDLNETVSTGEKIMISLLRRLLPPHPDNENAADFLRVNIGQNNPYMEWVAVRPDSLIDNESVSNYSLHKSPKRSAIFNPGKTSRINVGNFMANLISDNHLWEKWKGQMPVIYNDDGQTK